MGISQRFSYPLITVLASVSAVNAGVITSAVAPVTTHAPLFAPSYAPGTFFLSFETPPDGALKAWVTDRGEITNDPCLAAKVMLDTSGRLSTDDGRLFSTTTTTKFAAFVPSQSPGNIASAWQLDSGVLSWHNTAFAGGVASVCFNRYSNSFDAYFLASPPGFCKPVILRPSPVSLCTRSTSQSIAFPSVKSSISIQKSIPRPPSTSTQFSSTKSSTKLSTTTTTSTSANRFYPSTATRTGQDMRVTVTVTIPAYGMAYNAYHNPYNPEEDSNFQDDFDNVGISHFNSEIQRLVTCGVAQDVNYLNDDIYDSVKGYLPGQKTLTNLSALAVIYHGWFLPPTTGVYKFASSSSAFGYIWSGQEALTSWSNDNWNSSSSPGGPQVSYAMNLTQGLPIPMTILYANPGGRVSVAFKFRDPNSNTYTDFTGFFVQPFIGERWSPRVHAVSTCPQPPLAIADGNTGP